MRLQGIKKRLNLHFRPNSILVTVSLTLILMASGLVIIWMAIPDWVWIDLQDDMGASLHGVLPEIALFGFTSVMWVLITSLAGLIVIAGKMDKRVSTVEES
ncbi:MAG: hypothetical protein ACXADF_18310 [Candidatus Thorarchaeota archaeon]